MYTQRFPCALHALLINLEARKSIGDELHLLLRSIDEIKKDLKMEACDMDKCLFARKEKEGRSCWDSSLYQVLRRFIFCFGSEASLSGKEMKKLLKYILSQLRQIKSWHLFINLWQNLSKIYSKMYTPGTSAMEMFQVSKSLLQLFISMEFVPKMRITPYIHSLVYHVPGFVARFVTSVVRPLKQPKKNKTNTSAKMKWMGCSCWFTESPETIGKP